MDKPLRVIAVLFALLFSSTAFAEPDFAVYLGAGGGAVQVEAVDAFDKDVQFKVGEVLGGIRYKWIGLESRAGVSLEDENVKIGMEDGAIRPLTAKTSIDSYHSAYVRIQFYNEIARVYGLYGQTAMTTFSEFSDGTLEQFESEGSSYAIGAGIQVNPRLYFNVEARNLLSNEIDSFWGLTFNIDFRVL